MRWDDEDGSGGFHDGQQLPRPADGHEPGEVVIVGGEVLVGWEADVDDGFRVEALGFVDGGVADAAGAVLFFGAFAEVSASEDAVVAEWAFGEGGLRVEDEDVGRITEAGFFLSAEDGFDEVASIGSCW